MEHTRTPLSIYDENCTPKSIYQNPLTALVGGVQLFPVGLVILTATGVFTGPFPYDNVQLPYLS